MRTFAEAFLEEKAVQQVVARLPWGHAALRAEFATTPPLHDCAVIGENSYPAAEFSFRTQELLRCPMTYSHKFQVQRN